MIDQLIQQVTSKLGISDDMATKGVGMLMGFFKSKGDSGAVSEIFSKIPGAADLASQFEGELGGEAKSGGGGLLGGLMSKLGGKMGGQMGGAMEAMDAFKKTGLSMDQAKDMLPVAKDFLEENVGQDAVGKVFDSIPALKGLLR